jgi:uncharacterized protein (DUF58 family)
MSEPQEFHYRLSQRMGGHRPGSHASRGLGAGLEFATHMSLFDRPDPRRLDVRASLRSFKDEWLVRVNRQRAGILVHAVVDVSSSMSFGTPESKLHVAADFVEALGTSAFRVGDAFGMLAFDSTERSDLYSPARLTRGAGSLMAARLRDCVSHPGSIEGLEQAIAPLAAREGLVFLVSDFHWPLARLNDVLDLLVHADVVPIVIWDPNETTPPTRTAVAPLADIESGAHRTLWLRKSVQEKWRNGVIARRAELQAFFAERFTRPFFIEGRFDAQALSRYFFEGLE